MRKSTHAATGLTSSLLISKVFVLNPLYALAYGLIYSLLPDADTGYSFINKYLIRVKWLRNKYMSLYYVIVSAFLFGCYYYTQSKLFLIIGIMTTLLVIGKHRTFYHSLLILIPHCILLHILNVSVDYQALAVFSYITHLVLDMFNPSGVMLFYPLSSRVYRFPITINSKSWISKVVEWILTATMLCYTGYVFLFPLL